MMFQKNLQNGEAVSISNDVFILGIGNTYQDNYKYNTLTDTYTKLSLIPGRTEGLSACPMNTDIYLFGVSHDNVYKYDTLTNTFTQMNDLPMYMSSSEYFGRGIWCHWHIHIYIS